MKHLKRNYLLSVGAILLVSSLQKAEAQNFAPNPILSTQYLEKGQSNDKLEGSPFLFENFVQAKITTGDGLEYDNVNILYNVMTEKVYAEIPHNHKIVAVQNVNSILVNNDKALPSVYLKSGFPVVKGNTTKSLYQVLTAGKVTLLKKDQRDLFDNIVYGKALNGKKIVRTSAHYLFHDNQITEIKSTKKYVLEALATNQKALSVYIDNNNINLKEDSGLQRVVNYYNSL